MAERVPHPALRALWSLGSAPGETLRALEAAVGPGEALSVPLDRAERTAVEAVAPLLSPPQATGSAALERALTRRETPAPPVEGAGEEGPAVERPRPRRAPARAGAVRSAPVAGPAGTVDAAALERMAALAPEDARASTRRRGGGRDASASGRGATTGGPGALDSTGSMA
ncbi:MAG TPA: hypothetical protein VND93_22130, partial [Myxococcales bacterium]|nr:hypothetical protein [Myxococcales bacterium]